MQNAQFIMHNAQCRMLNFFNAECIMLNAEFLNYEL